MTWIYLLKDKSSVASVFPEFLQYVKVQYKTSVKAIRSDNAPELAFHSLLRTHGIVHFFSCPYTPQQNSVVERKHQHILNVARALLFQSKVPLQYWGECIQTAVYLINRTPSPLLQNKSPFELMNRKQPSYDHLRVFGSLCFASTLFNLHCLLTYLHLLMFLLLQQLRYLQLKLVPKDRRKHHLTLINIIVSYLINCQIFLFIPRTPLHIQSHLIYLMISLMMITATFFSISPHRNFPKPIKKLCCLRSLETL